MKELHLIYMRHAIDELQHDAIMAEAARHGIDTPKKLLNFIVASEIVRLTDRFKKGLSAEELEAYKHRGSECQKGDDAAHRCPDLDIEIPF